MIVGAGLAGLIAAHAFPRMPIVDAAPSPEQRHQALLRFRSEAISDITGIPFRKVSVHKGIWDDGWKEPNPASCNRYSRKVIASVEDRSIWNVASAVRWIAPRDFYQRLFDGVGHRVTWNRPYLLGEREVTISTMPLAVLAPKLGCEVHFRYKPVTVTKFVIPDCDVFQTVYFPSEEHGMYRASITGDEMICEWADVVGEALAARELAEAFGIPALEFQLLGELGESTRQEFGKIAPVDNVVRRQLIARLTNEYGVFSLGRFATWRNIMLDDIPHDISVIKKLLTATEYERRLASI